MAGVQDMQGKVVLYTGAAGGLGLQTTLQLMGRGATVVAVDNDPAKAAALQDAATSVTTGRLVVSIADLSDLEGFRAELKARLGEVGGFDVVINNAAVYPSKPFEDYSIEEHQAVQRINVDAGVVAVQEALPGMRERAFGRIINISSITISGEWANLSPYVASKGALIGLTRAWAREFGAYGITVNAIAPGPFPPTPRPFIRTPRAMSVTCWTARPSNDGGTSATSPTPSLFSPPKRRASSPVRRCTSTAAG